MRRPPRLVLGRRPADGELPVARPLAARPREYVSTSSASGAVLDETRRRSVPASSAACGAAGRDDDRRAARRAACRAARPRPCSACPRGVSSPRQSARITSTASSSISRRSLADGHRSPRMCSFRFSPVPTPRKKRPGMHARPRSPPPGRRSRDGSGSSGTSRRSRAAADRSRRRSPPITAPDEGALPLAVDPGMEVVGDEREREARLLGPARVAHEIERTVLLARQRVPDVHARRYPARPGHKRFSSRVTVRDLQTATTGGGPVRSPRAFLFGPGTAFLLDPRQGGRRRHVLRARSLALVRRGSRLGVRKARFAGGHARAAVALSRRLLGTREGKRFQRPGRGRDASRHGRRSVILRASSRTGIRGEQHP